MMRKNETFVLLIAGLFLASPLASAAEAEKGKGGNKTPAAVTVATRVKEQKTPTPPVPLISDDYRLGVNDVIDVHVWREDELSRVIPVRPDGKISLPLVGELDAQGRTALELRATITERLRAYVAEPEVTVIVREINSQRYFVMGEVQSPGAYPLTVPTTVLQALSMAGGFREFADTGDILILRRTKDNRTIRIRFSYKAWIKNKKMLEHMQLRNGDIIVVP